MVTTIDTTQAQYFIPEIWANRALEVLRQNMVFGNLVTRDTELSDSFSVGDILHIPYPGTFTANAKAAGTVVTLQAPSGEAEVTVTLDKHYEVSFIIEDIAKVQANQSLMDQYVQSAVVAIAEKIESTLFALYSTLTTNTAVGTAGTDLTYATTLSAQKSLTDAKAPLSDRYAIISTKDHKALLSDTGLVSFFQNSRPQDVTDGAFGRLSGFDFFVSQGVVAVAGTPVSTKNLFFNRGTFILAQRRMPDAPPGAGVLQATIEDSGYMIRVTGGYSQDNLGMQVTLDALWGVKVLRGEKGVVALS